MEQHNDISKQLQDNVLQAIADKDQLKIVGGRTKDFYGRRVGGTELNISQHHGIINYQPTELVLTARAGTKLSIINALLSDNNQMLAFEPPAFGDDATLGGTIACNLSGPRRAYSGAARDFVLGAKVLNGNAEILAFGGEVMKNVAGYDVSRLMTGAMGTLGVLLDVSIKVLPKPETEMTIVFSLTTEQALLKLQQWSNQYLPVSGSCFFQGRLYVRLSGSEKTLRITQQSLGGEILKDRNDFWFSIKEQRHHFFSYDVPLWRVSSAANTPILAVNGEMLYEWGGALRWLKAELSAEQLAELRRSINGHISLFRTSGNRDEVFQPLPNHLLRIHCNLKQAFDPQGIFNIGRMYQQY